MNQMFRAVKSVQDELLKQFPNGEYIPLENIVRAVEGLTSIDETYYVKFDVNPQNPIWGEFTRWSRQPSAYAPFQTAVEVRYASHLNKEQRRFVVCKELCHALDAYDGTCVSPRTIDSLVNSFALASQDGHKRHLATTSPAEVLAEVCARELMLPYQVREKILESTGTPNYAEIAEKHGMMDEELASIFGEGHMGLIKVWLNG